MASLVGVELRQRAQVDRLVRRQPQRLGQRAAGLGSPSQLAQREAVQIMGVGALRPLGDRAAQRRQRLLAGAEPQMTQPLQFQPFGIIWIICEQPAHLGQRLGRAAKVEQQPHPASLPYPDGVLHKLNDSKSGGEAARRGMIAVRKNS